MHEAAELRQPVTLMPAADREHLTKRPVGGGGGGTRGRGCVSTVGGVLSLLFILRAKNGAYRRLVVVCDDSWVLTD